MTDLTTHLLIASAGTAIGVASTLLTEEIKAALGFLGQSNRDLRGEWSCIWNLDPSGGYARGFDILDTVTIQHAGKRQILARAHGPAMDKYRLRGSISRANAITFTFECEKTPNLTGTVVLKLDVLRRTLSGFWLQVDPSGEICRGTATWRKQLGA